MADTPATRRKRSSAKDSEPDGAEENAAQAAADEQPTEAERVELDGGQDATQPEDGGVQGDDAPVDDGGVQGSDPELAGGGEGGDEAIVHDSGEGFDKAVLVANAETILPEYSTHVVRGVLAQAPDTITLAEARQRIDRFLTSPVTTSQEA